MEVMKSYKLKDGDRYGYNFYPIENAILSVLDASENGEDLGWTFPDSETYFDRIAIKLKVKPLFSKLIKMMYDEL